MEDAHSTILDLLEEDRPTEDSTDPLASAGGGGGGGTTTSAIATATQSSNKKKYSFFGVYDGHGGSSVAIFSGKQLHRRIVADKEFKNSNYPAAIKNGFLGTDEDLKTNESYLSDPAGCTAVTVLITEDWKVFCGNAGDSRAVLSVNGEAYPLSYDHKPTNPLEIQRIREAGGYVEFGRVNGNLALSRAVGDFEFKQNTNLPPELQIVTVNPDIESKQLELDTDEFIVLACDGIWDCMTNAEVVFYVRSQIADGHSLGRIAENIMDKCLAPDSDVGGFGCDNMTVIIVALLGSKSYEEWSATVKERFQAQVKVVPFDAGKSDGTEEDEAVVDESD
ncbi:Protein phosphatase 2C 2 [Blyttiomyces sp. JEL0837]|nr:Protein phosphatase 2C 2 [Blyttiomyces sp. JEL0837]